MNKLMVAVFILLVAGCREKYLSPVPDIRTGYLVVEGIVNNGPGQTNIRLSRTTSLNDNGNLQEAGALVQLQSSGNTFIPLPETSFGSYTISNLQLDTTLRYRLVVKTRDNEEYFSDYVAVRNTPAIDSINWVREAGGVQLYINTHDTQNNSRYYQWEFSETWEYHPPFFSNLKFIKSATPPFVNVGVDYRTPADPQIYTCWKYNSSTALLLGSSAKLSQDIIHLPISFIKNAEQKLSVLYSILVSQYSWSKEGYEFLERMKRNTESVGSVFDAQPSELIGNIHCTSNPALPAIGFFNICTIQQKRIFIKNADLPSWGYTALCAGPVKEVKNMPDSILDRAVGLLPISPNKLQGFSILSFDAADANCVDCSLTGSNVKPIYWP